MLGSILLHLRTLFKGVSRAMVKYSISISMA